MRNLILVTNFELDIKISSGNFFPGLVEIDQEAQAYIRSTPLPLDDFSWFIYFLFFGGGIILDI